MESDQSVSLVNNESSPSRALEKDLFLHDFFVRLSREFRSKEEALMSRTVFLASILSVLFSCAGATLAQSITQPSRDGMSILQPNPITNPAISNINLSHIGLPEGEWQTLAPQPNGRL